MKKLRLLSALLCIIMIFTFIPTVSAASNRSFGFEKLGGGTITQDDCGNKTIVFVFLKEGCSNSYNTITSLASADWIEDENVQVIACDITAETNSDANTYFHAFGCYNTAILYAYGEETASFMWSLLRQHTQGKTSVGLACAIIVDTNGNITAVKESVHSAAEIKVLLPVDGDSAGESGKESSSSSIVNVTFEGTVDYSQAYEVFTLLNTLRGSLGLDALVFDEELLDTAMLRAAECAIYYSHTRPDGTMCITAFPEGYFAAGENIAIGQPSAAAVMDAWTNSPGHYANMTSEDFDAVGIGCFKQNDGSYAWVQVFTGGKSTKASVKSGTVNAEYTVAINTDNLSLSISPGTNSIEAGDVTELSLSTVNEEFPYTSIIFKPLYSASSDENVAIVSGDSVTGISNGTTYIRLGISEDFYAVSKITVTGESVPVTDIECSTEISLKAGITYNPQITIIPENATFKTYEITTDDTEIVSIIDGKICANKVGTATVTVVCGKISKAIKVTVFDDESQEEKKEEPKSTLFKDINTADWFYDDVAYVYENKLMSGTGNDNFSPYDNTTRGMIVTILYRLEGEPEISSSNPFTDVASGSWYEKAICWAETNGIVSGYGNNLFGPNDVITREQLAAILYRYANFKGYDTETKNNSVFEDFDTVSAWAKEPIKWANGCGLINGITSTTIVPRGNALRCQVAAILHRFCKSYNAL